MKATRVFVFFETEYSAKCIIRCICIASHCNVALRGFCVNGMKAAIAVFVSEHKSMLLCCLAMKMLLQRGGGAGGMNIIIAIQLHTSIGAIRNACM